MDILDADHREHALMVIDMQPEFDTAHDPSVLQACTRAIRRAKRQEQPIIVVLYTPGSCGTFLLNRLVANYEHTIYVYKDTDDGSQQVRRTLQQYDLAITDYDVCGVNLSACVMSTILGLVRHQDKKRCRLLLDACNDHPIQDAFRAMCQVMALEFAHGLITCDPSWDTRGLTKSEQAVAA